MIVKKADGSGQRILPVAVIGKLLTKTTQRATL
jgi:hypothetical protein